MPHWLESSHESWKPTLFNSDIHDFICDYSCTQFPSEFDNFNLTRKSFKKIRENAALLLYLIVENFILTRKIVKIVELKKIVKIQRFCAI